MTDSLAFSFLLNSQSVDKPTLPAATPADMSLMAADESADPQFGQLVSQFMASDTVKANRQNTAITLSGQVNVAQPDNSLMADREDNSSSLQLLALINQAGATDVSWKAAQHTTDAMVLADDSTNDDSHGADEQRASVTASVALKPSDLVLVGETVEQQSKNKDQIIIQPVVPPAVQIASQENPDVAEGSDSDTVSVELSMAGKDVAPLAAQSLKPSERVVVGETIEQQSKDKDQIIIQPIAPPTAEIKAGSDEAVSTKMIDGESVKDNGYINNAASQQSVKQQTISTAGDITQEPANQPASSMVQASVTITDDKVAVSDTDSDTTEVFTTQAKVAPSGSDAVVVQSAEKAALSDIPPLTKDIVAEASERRTEMSASAVADEQTDKQPKAVVTANREQVKADSAASAPATAKNSSDNVTVKTDTASTEQENQQQLAGQSRAAGVEQQAAVARNDSNAFNSLIEAAQQRQQVKETPAASVQEQLKQSLNLLQQDAAGQMRERVSLMLRQNIQVAEIRLDPAELGQMQIKINMQQEQASVQFIVQQSHAKELLEQQLPRLRDMLQQQGIQLAEGQVQQQQQQTGQHTAQQRATQHGQTLSGEADGSDMPQPTTVNVKVNDRLVDYYA